MHTLSDLRSGSLRGIVHLVMRENLEEFPEEIIALADTLEILDLSGNRLRTLPDSFALLTKLRIVFFSFNQFESVPEVLGRCPSLEMVGFKSNVIATLPEGSLPERLRWLILTDNRLDVLPVSLGDRARLQKLMLSGNCLESLPDLSRCENLELARLANNRFSSLPDSLFRLPKLAWLAYSGNPFCRHREPDVRRVSWTDLVVKEKIGEGASGTVFRAKLRNDSVPDEVAVKVFRGTSTSDGRPLDEIAATCAAGAHQNLVPVLGRLTDSPDGSEGLVLRLIPDRFHNLAGPPSFESCTRDVYASRAHTSSSVSGKIIEEMGSLLQTLHDRGIYHGDFYAHNMLVDGNGSVLLGDFGAAGFLDDLPPDQARGMISIERRAFAVLREELSASP